MNKKIKHSLIASTILASTLGATDTIVQQNLGFITVTSATKTTQSIKDITSNIEVISDVELEEKHITTVKDALNLVSGISFNSNGGLGSNGSIYLRGAGNSRTLVLVDGIKYQDPSSISGANIQHLMVTNIKRIEIIKGAQSGIWGADASAGVINIITKQPKSGTHGSVFVEAGSFKTRKYGTTLSYKDTKFYIQLNGQKTTSDSFTVQAPRDENIKQYENDAYSNKTLNLKINYNINDEAKINANITTIKAFKEYDSFGDANDTTMKSDISNKLYNISYLQTIKNHNLKLKIEQSEFSRDEIGTVAAWGSEFVKVFNGKTNNIELSDHITYNQNDFIIFGAGASADTVDYVMTDNMTKYKKNKDQYIYLTNSNHLNKAIFTQSLRYDSYNNFDDKLTGKFGIKYNFNENLYLGANIGTAYNVPNIVQELNPWGATNSEINPENSKNADITLGYKGMKLTYFYNKINDLIQWYDPDGWGGSPAIYKNLDGVSTLKGFEFTYEKEIMSDLLFNINYTRLSTKDKNNEDLARRVKETIKFGLDYYGISGLYLGINGEYIGQRYDKANKQGEQTGKYTVANFVVNYDITNKIQVYGKIDNMFNKYYQTVDGYTTSPRGYYAGVKIQF